MRYAFFVKGLGLILFFLIILPISSAQLNSQNIYSIKSSGTIVTSPINDDSSIFFEYGAESSLNVWDVVGNNAGDGVAIDFAHVRNGNNAVKMFQSASPTKSDDQRRIRLTYFGSHNNLNEFYFSFWAYFDNNFQKMVNTSHDWGPVFGGTTSYWYNPGIGWNTLRGLRLYWIFSPNMKVQCYLSGNDAYHYNSYDLGSYQVETSPTQYTVSVNSWHQFQVYFKKGNMSTGHISAWVDGVKILDKVTATDPAYWHEPQTGDNYISGTSYWSVGMLDYTSTDTLPHGIWFDDIVLASEYVPASYRVEK